jgi:hypothetical protein
MAANNIFGKNTGAITAIILVILIFLPLAYSVASHVLAQTERNEELFLQMPDPQYKNCVRETDYMRYHHWELLRGIREEVVRYGIRGDVGLGMCKNCHTSREQFCNKCHDSVSMTPDCFGCHYYP